MGKTGAIFAAAGLAALAGWWGLMPPERSCCAQELAMATCTGSATCRACRTCSSCGHCKGGGTCGVCSLSTQAPAPPTRTAAAPAPPAEPPRVVDPAVEAEAASRLERAIREADDEAALRESKDRKRLASTDLRSAQTLESLGQRKGALAIYRAIIARGSELAETRVASGRIAVLDPDGPQTQLSAPVPTEEAYKSLACRVIRVVDGDTVVDLYGRPRSVRLIGVDTPETVHPSKPVERFGAEASSFLRSLLEGQSVRLEYEAGAIRYDRYGRLLAYLYRVSDGLDVNLVS